MMITSPMIPVVIMLPVVVLIFVLLAYGAYRYNVTLQKRIAGLTLAALISLTVFCINLRFMKYNPDSEYTRPNLDVLFVVDTTISMWAEDYDRYDTRMSGARKTCEHIMEELQGSSFCLVTFDDDSRVLMPLTQDAQSISDCLYALTPPSQYVAKGSSLNAPFDNIKRMLEHMGKEDGHSRIVFFISDGEITNEEELISYAELSDMIDGGAVLGFGTDKGATMQDNDGYDVYDYTTYGKAVSCIDEDNLLQIATDLGVSYIHVNTYSDVDAVIGEALTNAETVTDTREGIENYDDTYFYLVPVLMVLLLGEIFITRPAALSR
ncbi:MAG: VWA domain-containing protein [Butyrivibrio sp.]|nr:VWA domain-containing protein [Butyrivibrio sp.]